MCAHTPSGHEKKAWSSAEWIAIGISVASVLISVVISCIANNTAETANNIAEEANRKATVNLKAMILTMVTSSRQDLSDCLQSPHCSISELRYSILQYEIVLKFALENNLDVKDYYIEDDLDYGFCRLVAAFNEKVEPEGKIGSELCQR